eukprot:Skav208356  [mRNA]  locus=scaffold1964:254949:261067:+ [translate_table: standard]
MLLALARQQRSLQEQLTKVAAHGPHVHGHGVALRAQQELRGSVPQRHHVLRDGTLEIHEFSGQTEVREFQHALVIQEQVGQFDVPMDH